MIVLEDVSKSYSTGAPALNGINLKIKRGEFVFVVGDSGSGKSTLIKLLLRELL
ncbi:MAG: ATP-binding cassette domain-containing protein, partial [Lachnospiraceae bacterium]